MADLTATTMETYLPEHTSVLATITYRSNVVLPDLFDRRWEPELGVGRGDTVNIPAFTQNAAASKRSTFGTGASLTYSALTDVEILLIVDQMAYKAYRMPIEMTIQRMAIYEPLLTDGIGLAVALQIDSDLASDNTNGIDGWSTVVGTDNVDITDDNIITCETNLNNANAPLENRFLVVSPATRGSMLKIDVLRNQLYQKTNDIKMDMGPGYFGDVYTFHTYMSNNLEAGSAGKKNGAWQQEATAFVMQSDIKIVEQIDIDAGFFKIVAGYAVYGQKEVKDSFGNELDGK